MQEPINNTRPNQSVELIQSLEVIHHFLSFFPPATVEKEGWELIHYAFSSDDAGGWSSRERSDRLFFYRQLTMLAPALAIIDERLWPLFVRE
jgi:hypothetical protein